MKRTTIQLLAVFALCVLSVSSSMAEDKNSVTGIAFSSPGRSDVDARQSSKAGLYNGKFAQPSGMDIIIRTVALAGSSTSGTQADASDSRTPTNSGIRSNEPAAGVLTAEELVQHIFNTGIIGVDSKGAPLYEADFSKMEPTDSCVIDEIGYQKVQFLNPRRISFGSKYFMDLWRPAPEPQTDKAAHWDNASEKLTEQKGVRLFLSSYANLLNDNKFVQPRSWRQRASAVRPDRGRNFTMSVSMFNPRYYAAPNANVNFFGEDNLETEIPWDAPELNQPDISLAPLMLNWSTNDSNLKPLLEIPKMNVKDAER